MKDIFSEEQLKQVSAAIEAAEKNTSGELRVHIGRRCAGDPVKCAQRLFTHLGMKKTKRRNGVLFYLAVVSRKFAVIGDEGIHAKVGSDFWHSVREKMENEFREGRFTEGLISGITEAGRQLEHYFPPEEGDSNELPDEISIEK
ncbi:MAG TPA: TPM domain-containing protein [Bacteroidia bacterium]|nr:TPM domain-containing protein [Bacteroidia bacterium]